MLQETLNNCVSGAVFSLFARSMRASSINIFWCRLVAFVEHFLDEVHTSQMGVKGATAQREKKIVCLFLCAGVDNDGLEWAADNRKSIVSITLLAPHTTHRHAWGRTSENTRGEFVKIRATNRSAAWCLMQAQRRPMTFCSAVIFCFAPLLSLLPFRLRWPCRIFSLMFQPAQQLQ